MGYSGGEAVTEDPKADRFGAGRWMSRCGAVDEAQRTSFRQMRVVRETVGDFELNFVRFTAARAHSRQEWPRLTMS